MTDEPKKPVIDNDLKRILNESLAERIKLLFGFCYAFTVQHEDVPISDLELLKEGQKDMQERTSNFETIGFISPLHYESKMKDNEARLKRLNALVSFIETLMETDKELQDSKQLRGNETKSEDLMSRIFGL